jgi:hypothetical protein
MGIAKPKKKSWEYSHLAYSYTYNNQGDQIKQATGPTGFVSENYRDVTKKRYSKIWAYEFKHDIDFVKLDKLTKSHIGDKYQAWEAAYSAINNIPVFSSIFRKIFNIKKNDSDFSFCNKAVVLILKDQGYLTVEDNSLSPSETIEAVKDMCHIPKLVWNKQYFVNNVFLDEKQIFIVSE